MTGLDGVIYDAAEIVVGPTEARPRGGRPDSPDEVLELISDGAIAIVDRSIAAVGPTDAVTSAYPPEEAVWTVDASGQTILPGYVDAHTHAVFAGDRSDEFAMKLRGQSYQEILAEGGGILRTVRAVRKTSEDTLVQNLHSHLDRMLAHGTTTVEVKSGYGLDLDNELKLLRAIERADRRHPIDIVPTFLGAHAIPPDHEPAEYITRVVEEQLPAVGEQGIAEFCDVFCDDGAFDVSQSRRVLEAGRDHGLKPKIHADEFARLGASQLAAEVGAASADHLLQSNTTDIQALVDAGVIPVLLPGTAFQIGGEYADARAFCDRGSPVGLATDFNPNCHTRSMSFAVALACTEMGLTPAEAIRGGTRDAALALDRHEGVGTLREGAPADLSIVDAPSHVHIPYTPGENLIVSVVKGGERVHG